jgi:ribonuclease G
MHTEIIINCEVNQTRIAILEDKKLVELLVERTQLLRIVGNIYKGVVTAILPGMQAAFVDIGLEKSAFLHASDVGAAGIDFEMLHQMGLDDGADLDKISYDRHVKIEDVLKKSQSILVQITKEPIGTKGPRVTTQLSLPGRHLVMIPYSHQHGISRKIESRAERDRLGSILKEIGVPETMGVIVRTVAEGKEARDFKADLKYLTRLWHNLEKKAGKTKAPALIHAEVGMTLGLIRDLFSTDVDLLTIDARDEHKEINSYLRNLAPELRSRVKLYQGAAPIFEAYGIEEEIEKAISRKVWLKKGGYITIDHTEALVSIDVNTGRYVGKRNPKETIVNTNLFAAREIARQLRLRDIGGLIVIDFIDMDDRPDREKVVNELRKELKRDRAKTKVLSISEMGLVEMSRQRERPSLLFTFTDQCPTCGGSGQVAGRLSVALSLERWFHRHGAALKREQIVVDLHPFVAVFMAEDYRDELYNLEKKYRLNIDIRDNSSLHIDDFLITSGKDGRNLIAEMA